MRGTDKWLINRRQMSNLRTLYAKRKKLLDRAQEYIAYNVASYEAMIFIVRAIEIEHEIETIRNRTVFQALPF